MTGAPCATCHDYVTAISEARAAVKHHKPFAHEHHRLTSRIMSAIANLVAFRTLYRQHLKRVHDREPGQLQILLRNAGEHLIDHANGDAA